MKKKKEFFKVFKNKKEQEYIDYLSTLIYNNQSSMGMSNIWLESKEEKITRLKKEIEEKSKELHDLEFKDKINGIIND